MMSQKFSRLEDRKLICLVKRHPQIYQYRSKKYRDVEARNNTWKLIAAQMGRKENDCKVRWRSIRDYYQKKKRDQKETNDTVHVKEKFSLLGFLENVTGENTDDNDFQNAEEDISIDEASSYEIKFENCNIITCDENETIQDGESKDMLEEMRNEDSQGSCMVEEVRQAKVVENVSDILPAPVNKRVYSVDEEDNEDTLLQEIKKSRAERTSLLRTLLNQNSNSQTSDPATSLFFQSITETVLKFRPELKNKAKLEVMKIISDLELQNISMSAGKS